MNNYCKKFEHCVSFDYNLTIICNMSRNEEKSRESINRALERLIQRQDYSTINVSDIISESGVARSTFYSHYKSKDDVLIGIADNIFEHVLSNHLTSEKRHDFSSSPAFAYRDIVEHTFCHFSEDRDLIKAIFTSSASHLFAETLNKVATPLMEAVYSMSPSFAPFVPKEVGVSVLLGTFVGLLRSYIVEDRKETPEQMAQYFFSIRFPNN